MRLVLYTGKGGVGKTTTAAATALRAAECGRRTLVASADASHSLGDVLGFPLGPEPRELMTGLSAVEIDARAEMVRHWGRVRDYLVELFLYQGIEEVVAEELALLPGAEEMTTLLAVDELASQGGFDVVVLDCAPTATTLRLVTLPDVLTSTLRLLPSLLRLVAAAVTPVARGLVAFPLPGSAVFRDVERILDQRARALQRRLTGPETSVRLVLTPERMVIDEARRMFTELSLFDLACDAVVLNRLLPAEAAEESFFRDWCRAQEERRREVAALFEPLRVLDAPLREDEVTGLEALTAHGRDLFADVAPDAVISRSPKIRFARRGRGYQVRIPLPGACAEQLEVAAVSDELIVRAGPRRRALKLPPRIASLSLDEARLDRGDLIVSFAPDTGSQTPAPAARGTGA